MFQTLVKETDQTKINSIVSSIKSIQGVTVLDCDPGLDTNRTVVTFVGEPKSVVEAAFQGIKRASELIDMSLHKGHILALVLQMFVQSFL